MANATTQLQLSHPPASLLDRSSVELIQELIKQVPDFAVLAALLSTCRAMPVTVTREVVKETSADFRRNRLGRQPDRARVVLFWMGAVQSSFGNSKSQLAWAPPASTPAPNTSLMSDWGETLMWSQALAEPPLDAMGEDHFRFMGGFLRYGDASPDTLEMLALDAFEERLALSRKHGTWFAEQVSPGWRNGTPRKHYQERWNGDYDRLVWSFGIQGHPRADQIWKLMRARLPRDADPITQEFPHDVSDIEPALRPEMPAIRSWTFSYQPLKFSIFEDQRGNFYLSHAKSRDIRDVIRPRLAKLWRATLNRHKSHNERLHCLAEFEWLWYWTNPFVRGGATTGGLLSSFLQRSLRNEGLKIRIRDRFVMQDLYALSSDWGFYVRERVAGLARSSRKGHSPFLISE